MIRRTILPLLVALALSCAGCCDHAINFGVLLHVQDSDGSPAADATVSYTVDGTPQPDVHTSVTGDASLGIEESGRYVVTAADGSRVATDHVQVGSSGSCHVRTMSLTLTLPP